MDYEIKLEGDKLVLLEKRVVKTVAADNFMEQLGKLGNSVTPLLPVGCRMCASGGDSTVVVIETPARQMKVAVNTKDYVLSTPFTQFFLRVKESRKGQWGYVACHVTATKKPLQSEDDAIYKTPFPNTYDDGRLCTGSTLDGELRPLPELCRHFVAGFFGSTFNSDLGISFPALRMPSTGRSGISGYVQVWADETEKDPFFALQESTKYSLLAGGARTVKGMLEKCTGRS